MTLRRDKDKIDGITNKYVLITGCGSGFGKEITQRLDQLGFRVFATCRTKQGEDSVREVCSDRVKTYIMDVTDSKQVQDVFERIKKEIPDKEGNSKKRLAINILTHVTSSKNRDPTAIV